MGGWKWRLRKIIDWSVYLGDGRPDERLAQPTIFVLAGWGLSRLDSGLVRCVGSVRMTLSSLALLL